MTPAVVNETIMAAKTYLDGELRKYKSVKKLPPNLINLLDSKTNEQAFSSLKTKGAGQTTILKFLGKLWKQNVIQEALDTIKSDDIDEEAMKQTKTNDEQRNYKAALRKAKVPIKEQKQTIQKAKKIVDELEKNEKKEKQKAKEKGKKLLNENSAISKRRKIQQAVNMVSKSVSEEEA